MTKILFVCMGNICRSPAAEGILQKMLIDQGLQANVILDSAGTHGYHTGKGADSRMIEFAEKRGYKLLSQSRQFETSDFLNFDLILVADEQNLQNIHQLDPNKKYRSKVKKIMSYCTQFDKQGCVPDPYYGGDKGFETVMDILEDACNGMIDFLKQS